MHVVQPLAHRLVLLLAPTRIQPHQLVLLHTGIGLLAAWLLARSGAAAWLAAALLLQVKSLLDNVDGGLARSTGRVTRMGRYLDTLMDLVVNVALFAALTRHGSPWLAWTALVALTLILSAEFNAMRRHQEEAGTLAPRDAPAGAKPLVMALLQGAYGLILAPQDRLLRRLDERLFRRASGREWGAAPAAQRRAWASRWSAVALVNLGLTTQMFTLGLCAALGAPYAYVMVVLLQLPYILLVQVRRVRAFRRQVAA